MTSRGQSEDGHAGLGGSGWNVGGSGNGSPLPPGFKSPNGYTHDDVRAQGEASRSAGGLASPPPPGFNAGGEKPRSEFSEQQIWSSQDDSGMPAPRTSSFNNLANALGSGLAESINDAVLTDNFFSNGPKGDLSYARQSRHAASRLLKTAPSKDAFGSNHTAPDAGPLFASFDSRERTSPKKGVPVHGGYMEGQSRDNDRSGDPYGSGLSAAFSNDAPDRFASYQPKSAGGMGYSGSGNGLNMMDSRLRTTKDLGMTVTEPTDSHGRGGRQDDGTLGIQRDMNNLWSNEPSPATKSGGGSKTDTVELERESEESLQPFSWDVRHRETSRALAIMRASSLTASDIRSTCEAFGVIETFRSDFADRGIFFVNYYDMRCSQYAAMELKNKLQRLSSGADKVLIQFCVPLNSSSQNDESLVILNDVPRDMDVDSLGQMLSSYGAVRSLKDLGGNYGGSSFVVEFHDVRDAKQAVLELESSQPWGPDVSVEVGARNPSDRKRGRELLALIGRWRRGENSPSDRRPTGAANPVKYGDPHHRHRSRSPEQPRTAYIPGSHAARHDVRYDRVGRPQETTQVVVGPDGKYHSYVVVNHSGHPPSYGGPPPPSYHGEHVVHSNHGTYVTHHVAPSSSGHYWSPPPTQHHFSGGGSVVSASSGFSESHHSGHYPSGSRSVPYFADGASSVGSHSHIRSVPEGGNPSRGDEKDNNRHLRLDFDAVEHGRDSRTSLMVRNIPNKYTQQMLLSEFAENGHGPGVIDFFYLPIDFKNKCNRGYAFINFVDYRDIVPFHRRYYGKHWRTFNSDKICEITYARIQGKSAMLKRFENSALMEKDEEYKPLVFVSHGADKGTRLPFSDPTNRGQC